MSLRLLLPAVALLGAMASWAQPVPEAAPLPAVRARIDLVVISGSINPASADHIIEGIERAEREGSAALLLELDTPGGLVSSTKDIIQAMLKIGRAHV